MNSDLICSVSSNGDLVALCSPDGVVKFYDTLTSTLKTEYSSSTHLQANCTCLSWSKHKKKPTTTTTKQKKTKTETSQVSIAGELSDLELIAIGTSQGSILLYSYTKAALHSQLFEDGHVDKVNDVCWCPQHKDALYSCSNDGFIIEWSFTQSKITSKWKASKTAITSIAIDSSSKYLICASKTISVWDLETKTKIKTLTGHSNDIFRMIFVNSEKSSDTNDFFISAALNDRVLNAWSMGATNNLTSAALAFTLNEGPIFIDAVSTKDSLKEDSEPGNYVLLNAVTNKGHLHVYSHRVDNKVKKPIKALHQIQIETNEGAPLKIHAAFFTNTFNERLQNYESSKDLTLYLLYGSSVNPVIEKMPLSDLSESKMLLKREDPFKTNVTLQSQSTKIETPSMSKELKVLAPGFMAPQTNNVIQTSKRKSIEPSQMTLEERLNVMGIESTNGDANVYLSQGKVPKTDNLLVLLVQGLQSNDVKMLNHVLQHKNEKIVANTVRLLPTNHIISLVKELNKRLQGHAQSGLGLIKWLKYVLMIHTSYLMSYPDLIDSLGSVYEMMNARTKLFPQLSKLQGKLQLVMSQISSQAESLQASNEKDGQPLLFYQDSNSEDEDIEEEIIPSHSEYDDYLFSEEDEEDKEDNENDKDDLENDMDDAKEQK